MILLIQKSTKPHRNRWSDHWFLWHPNVLTFYLFCNMWSSLLSYWSSPNLFMYRHQFKELSNYLFTTWVKSIDISQACFFCFHFLRIIFANGLVMKILIKIDSYYKFVNYRKLIDFQSANWANHAYLLLLRYARAIFRTRQIFWQRIRPWEHVLPFETIWKNKKSLFEAHPMGVAGTSFDENVPMDQFNWYMQ